jgi:protein-disulfide isomerase
MNRFYLALGTVAVIGGAALFYAAREKPGAQASIGALPPAPVASANGFHGFTLGSDSAPVEVIEYADFECPACASFATIQMPTVRDQLIATGKVRWRFRDFPLPMHQYSRFAALAAQCAGEQGKFWEMHDQLFFNHSWAQTGRNPSRLFRDFARTAGLDVDKYDACMDSQRYAGRIEASRQEGERLLVDGTPTFFINGQRFGGPNTSDGFKAAVDSVLAKQKKK